MDQAFDFDFKVENEHIWGKGLFFKRKWGFLNYLVGPNGTGKSRFSEALLSVLLSKGHKVRYLNSERLFGFEKTSGGYIGSSSIKNGIRLEISQRLQEECERFGYGVDLLTTLNSNEDIKLKVQTILSQLFNREIILETGAGILKVKVSTSSLEYDFGAEESHGLREILILLCAIYNEEIRYLIIDEPELHIHPQFQLFLMQEIRRISGNPLEATNKKCFFIVTHSPYFVDVKTMEDLKNCIIFRSGRLPAYIESVEKEDEAIIKKTLPLLNTHHKQFFFSSNPIFVEGYRDQQLFSLLCEKRGLSIGATGHSIIDIGGKDQLDTFFRISNTLKLDARIICDLDSLFRGKLRQSIRKNTSCQAYLIKYGEGDLLNTIGNLERKITYCVKQIDFDRNYGDSFINYFVCTIKKWINDKSDDKVRTVFAIATNTAPERLYGTFSNIGDKIKEVYHILDRVINALESANIFILSKGEIENYYNCYSGNPFDVLNSAKQALFQSEFSNLLDLYQSEVDVKYKDIISILDKVIKPLSPDVQKTLNRTISDWIHQVQMAIKKNKIVDEKSLILAPNIGWSKYSQLWSIKEFRSDGERFQCTIKLNPNISSDEKEFSFNEYIQYLPTFSLKILYC